VGQSRSTVRVATRSTPSPRTLVRTVSPCLTGADTQHGRTQAMTSRRRSRGIGAEVFTETSGWTPPTTLTLVVSVLMGATAS